MCDFILATKGTIFYLGTAKSPCPVFDLDIMTDKTSWPYTIECSLLPSIRTGNEWLSLHSSPFKVYSKMKGIQWHVDGYGEVCEFCAQIKDTSCTDEKPRNIMFYAGNFTKRYSERDIAQGIITFFNNLLRFQTIDDYMIWDSIRKSQHRDWARKRNGEKPIDLALEDKILQIGDVIKLYKKYISINPVFTYKAELRKWIEKNLKKMISE